MVKWILHTYFVSITNLIDTIGYSDFTDTQDGMAHQYRSQKT